MPICAAKQRREEAVATALKPMKGNSLKTLILKPRALKPLS